MPTAAAVITVMTCIILVCPLSYRLRIEHSASCHYRARIGFLILYLSATGDVHTRTVRVGILGVPVFRSRRDRERESNVDRKAKNQRADRRSASTPAGEKKRSGLSIDMLTRENLHHVGRFVQHLIQTFQPKTGHINLLVGLGEPDLNGMALALFYTLKGCFPSLPLSCTMVWNDEVFRGEGQVAGSFAPAHLLRTLIPFLLSRRTLHLGRQIIRQRGSSPSKTAGWILRRRARGNFRGKRSKNAGEHVQ